eukprot:TRINITY_DN10869_c0_g1_i1.p1 TRINITY_DN10869_c0_g1~~TRINITY_DN10869_c0_g1_i1.p1  ORF type:complete len:433 (+),score=92.71 TRINITY_DN10869_c0_g1_i1:154-1452(+)
MSKRKRDEDEDLPVRFEDVSTAAFRIRSGIRHTDVIKSYHLSKALGMNIFLKMESRQQTGSFKERGGLNALLMLSPEQRKKGAIAASAGNHALALALHGSRLNIPITVVMPLSAPLTKVSNCEEYGARIFIHGSSIAEAREKADEIAAEEGQFYINGFDDPAILAGAGTVGVEICEQLDDLDAVIVPVGGAGLIAGIALAVNKLRPEVEVIGVEPDNCPSLTAALEAGGPVAIPVKPTLADGLLVPKIGNNGYKICAKLVREVVIVEERLIALAVLRLLEMEKAVVEGAGAAGLAALLSGKLDRLKGKNVLIVICGGNIDITMLARVVERGLAADGRLIELHARISDYPGGLAAFLRIVADVGASVKEINHERAFLQSNLACVRVRVQLETRDASVAVTLAKALQTPEAEQICSMVTINGKAIGDGDCVVCS